MYPTSFPDRSKPLAERGGKCSGNEVGMYQQNKNATSGYNQRLNYVLKICSMTHMSKVKDHKDTTD